MKIKTELEKLNNSDIYSLMLFALYKANELPEYSALSQLAYILDKDNLVRFCEFFGGLTIRVPKIEELEVLVYSLLVFQETDIEHKPFDKVLHSLSGKGVDLAAVESGYTLVKGLLKDYNFNSGRS